MNKDFTIAIAGNPNCGKTALFNVLTGSNQVVGNWPGVTVEKKEGSFVLDGRKIRVVDIPGIYALLANSEDERAALDYLLSRDADLIINILDATNLERNLFLTTQLAEMHVPMVLAINMMDLANKRGLVLDLEELSKTFGVPVIPLTAVSTKSCAKFVRRLAQVLKEDLNLPKEMQHSELIEEEIASITPAFSSLATELNVSSRWVSVQYLSGLPVIKEKANQMGIEVSAEKIEKTLNEDPAFALADSRYAYIRQVVLSVVKAELKKETMTDKLDKIFLNRILALPLFLLVMYLVFWVAVTVGSAFIDFFDVLFGAVFVDGLALLLESIGAPDFLIALLASGVGTGIQTVATFVPVVFFMFLCLSILEDSGYMARAAFVADRIMRFLGLPGKAFVPMLVGFGCSVPAIMGCRILENKRERFLSIFLVPFMSCGARLPVYALFAAAFFGKSAGLVVFAIYLTGIIIALLFGLLLRHTAFKGDASPFIMELPSYHLPRPKAIWKHTWFRLRDFIWRAGKIVVIMVTILGVLNSVGTNGSIGNEDSENSILSAIGKKITPIFAPFGVEEQNWPASVALFTGLFAKEAVVGTLNSLYSIADASEESAESEEESFSLLESFKEAVGTIPENLSGIFGSIMSPLGVEESVETVSAMAKKQDLIQKIEVSNLLSEKELETLSSSEIEANWLDQIKPKLSSLNLSSADYEILLYAEMDEEQSSALSGMKKYFTLSKTGFNFQVFSYLLFILLYVPCLAALGTAFRELGNFYGIVLAVIQTLLGWSLSVLLFQVTVGHSVLWIVVSVVTLILIVAFLKWLGLSKHKIN